MPIESLNPAQRQAVEYTAGPLLIVAGAGTGKTTVITEKIAYIIQQGLAKPEEILALTFTDKAAAEMLERVDDLLEIGYVEMQISTFHSFCQRLLERHGLAIGIPNQFKLLTETDAWLLLREGWDKFPLKYYRPLGNPNRHIHEFIKHFQKCKDELIAPADYLAQAEAVALNADAVPTEETGRLKEIAESYQAYNQLLLDHGSLDFADLIYYAVKLVREREGIRAALQSRYKYILVDEFQDVNWSQYQLVGLLTNPAGQLTVVGDDDQSIYAFRGASVSNILRFKEDYPAAVEIVLNENYRSGQKILDIAYQSIQQNNPDRLEVKLGVNKKLESRILNIESAPPQPNTYNLTPITYLNCHTLQEEVQTVVKEIARLKESTPDAVWDNFAILVRANSHAEPFIHALESTGIPYEFLASAGLYRQPIVLDCFNFFQIIAHYHESLAIYRLLRLPCLSFKENDIQKLTMLAKKKSISYYEALKHASEWQLSPDGIALCDKLLAFIHDGMKAARTDKPTAVLLKFLEGSGYLQYLAHAEGEGNREAMRSIYHLQQWFAYLERYEQAVPGAGVAGFVEHYKYILESGETGALYQPTDTPDSVNIMTVHAAKGLEFRFVFIVNLVEERFPSRSRNEAIEIPLALVKEQLPEGDSHIEEERRLFYVAMTRAKERLYFASAEDYGGVRKKKISRFLDEIGFGQENTKTQKIDGTSDFGLQTSVSKPLAIVNDKAVNYEIPKVFSFSQIKSYETCPYQYKLAHILKIPAKGSGTFSFGQSIHTTMHAFYQRIQELNSASQGSLFLPMPAAIVPGVVQVPPLEELLALYDKHWIADWYESARQREDYYAKGKEILKVFYAAEDGNWTIPLALESWFKIKVGNYLLHGRIDRVDKLPDGTLEIIDYKTGASKAKVTGDEKDQLLIYQIAAQTLPEYRNHGAVGKLTFYYVNDGIRTSFLGDDPEIQKLQEKLVKTMSDIHEGNFTATPSQFVCGYCDFRDICEFRA